MKCPCTLSADGPSSPSHSIRSLDGTVKLAAMSDKVGPLCWQPARGGAKSLRGEMTCLEGCARCKRDVRRARPAYQFHADMLGYSRFDHSGKRDGLEAPGHRGCPAASSAGHIKVETNLSTSGEDLVALLCDLAAPNRSRLHSAPHSYASSQRVVLLRRTVDGCTPGAVAAFNELGRKIAKPMACRESYSGHSVGFAIFRRRSLKAASAM